MNNKELVYNYAIQFINENKINNINIITLKNKVSRAYNNYIKIYNKLNEYKLSYINKKYNRYIHLLKKLNLLISENEILLPHLIVIKKLDKNQCYLEELIKEEQQLIKDLDSIDIKDNYDYLKILHKQYIEKKLNNLQKNIVKIRDDINNNYKLLKECQIMNISFINEMNSFIILSDQDILNIS